MGASILNVIAWAIWSQARAETNFVKPWRARKMRVKTQSQERVAMNSLLLWSALSTRNASKVGQNCKLIDQIFVSFLETEDISDSEFDAPKE